ncbi:succinate--CoA ligase subunit alpha [Candidatus Woesearchaeota archaeon CG10_big_fil_rev_8_21_14_0_10_34_8]|nr:MAG: succinate--CoA ligase subunit alpha [Candidatus Woesearchaeota archaeon CG10_big_fil_rev_8_21_14_0_10_34_8]
MMIEKNDGVIVQGITGNQGRFHTKAMLDYGTKIVAGVTPGKKGEEVEGVKVYNSVKEALDNVEAKWSVVFVPARFCKDAVLDALENGLNVVVITEGVPVHDEIEIMNVAKDKNLKVIGPNCPGFILPGIAKLGIMPGLIFKEGKVAVVSRSGTLTYEVISELSRNNIGQSIVVGIGGDPVIGMNFIDLLKEFENDGDIETIVLIGEIGGDLEERAAEFLVKGYKKKVVAYIAGVTAPKGKKMGHAGAIISGKSGSAEGKIKALEKAGVKVAKLPSEIVKLL